ncbi:Transmembrane protease serine 13 [Bulinus truncatus]|nr:Transmembrane protease serine 13 [Bulinus truncatus]
MASNLILLFFPVEIILFKISSDNLLASGETCDLRPARLPKDETVEKFKGLYLSNFQEKREKYYNISDRYYLETVYNFRTSCGTMNYDPAASIVDGSKAPDDSWPWHVRVLHKVLKYDICGGVLIDGSWVLTAAHCVDKDEEFAIFMGTKTKLLIKSPIVRASQVRIIHDDYNSVTRENDIALIRLSRSVGYTHQVRAACLPIYRQDFVNNDFCYITGFGDTRNGFETELQQLKVYVVPDKECFYMRKAVTKKDINSRQICAGRVRQKGGICATDGGSPLSCKIGNKYYVAGVASAGIEKCDSKFLPDRFTKITRYMDWIFDTMNRHPY